MGIYSDITKTVGGTPLVRINKLVKEYAAEFEGQILAKLEYFNPMGSLKDRIAVEMIEYAEREGLLEPGGTIVEPTSGNTGIGLALVAAAKGYNLVLTMPESMSVERRKILVHLGAELVLTPAERRMEGAVAKAQELVETLPNAYMPQQFDNEVNLLAHERTTAREIWEDTEGQVDCFIAGVGTGGSLSGVAKGLKDKKGEVHIVAVEPHNSQVLAGKRPGRHLIQGIGAGFVPKIYRSDLTDETMAIRDDDAIEYTRLLAKHEGIFGGISTGAHFLAALEVARRPSMRDKTIVFLCCDTGERYLSTSLFAK